MEAPPNADTDEKTEETLVSSPVTRRAEYQITSTDFPSLHSRHIYPIVQILHGFVSVQTQILHMYELERSVEGRNERSKKARKFMIELVGVINRIRRDPTSVDKNMALARLCSTPKISIADAILHLVFSPLDLTEC